MELFAHLTAVLWLSWEWFDFPLGGEDIKIKAFDCQTTPSVCSSLFFRALIFTPFYDGSTNPHLDKIEYFINCELVRNNIELKLDKHPVR